MRQLLQYFGGSSVARRAACEDVIQDGSETVDVGGDTQVGRAPFGLLGGHKCRSPDDRAGLGHPVPQLGPDHCLTFVARTGSGLDGAGRIVMGGAVQERGQPPIQHVDLAVCADHDVAGFQVAVNDPLVMGVTDRTAHRDEHLQELEERPALWCLLISASRVGPVCRHHLRQSLTADKTHRVVVLSALGLADVIDRDDGRVLKPGGDLCLVPESPEVVGRGPLVHELQGNVTAKSRMESTIDHAHSASPKLGFDQVAVERGAQERQSSRVGPVGERRACTSTGLRARLVTGGRQPCGFVVWAVGLS